MTFETARAKGNSPRQGRVCQVSQGAAASFDSRERRRRPRSISSRLTTAERVQTALIDITTQRAQNASVVTDVTWKLLPMDGNTPIATGNMSDSLEALVNGEWVSMRIPYPLGFHSKGLDGRIDDASAGWKGRGLWSTYAGRAPYHIEGGKGTTSKVVHFQLRPDPLAR